MSSFLNFFYCIQKKSQNQCFQRFVRIYLQELDYPHQRCELTSLRHLTSRYNNGLTTTQDTIYPPFLISTKFMYILNFFASCEPASCQSSYLLSLLSSLNFAPDFKKCIHILTYMTKLM